jgi:hypothetical protein
VGRGPLDLAAEDPPRRHLDGPAVHGHQVAEDENTAGEPRQGSDRPGIEDGVEVAVTGVPVGELVAGQRRHVDVAGQQVVAHLDPVVHNVVEEEGTRHPLPDGPALEIRESDDDGVDFAGLDLMREGFQGQHPSTLTQAGRPVQPYSGVT